MKEEGLVLFLPWIFRISFLDVLAHLEHIWKKMDLSIFWILPPLKGWIKKKNSFLDVLAQVEHIWKKNYASPWKIENT